jgi:hypothetical protein
MSTTPIAEYIAAVDRAVEALRSAAAVPPREPITERELEARVADQPVEDLLALSDVITARIVLRAEYTALRVLSEKLKGRIAVSRENNASMGYRDEDRPDGVTRFHIADVHILISETASSLGLTDQWQAYLAHRGDA